MDLLTFTVELVKALAWPVAAMVLGLGFRTEIRALLSKMKKGKVGPAEFEFEQAVAAIKHEAPLSSEPSPAPLSEAAVQLAATEPRAAILNAWLEVQSEVERLVQVPVSEPSGRYSGSVSLRVLHRELQSQPEYIDMYNDLKLLRNQAVHDIDFRPRPDSVISYIELSKRLVSVLRKLRNAA